MKKRKVRIIQPNLDWYKKISSRNKLPPRCPYTTIYNCPRYYFSISLLGKKGITTPLDKEEDERCYKIWKKSELWSKRRDEEPSIMGTDTRKIYRNFCPEVVFEIFGIFATNLSEYADELDRNIAHKELTKIKAGKDDWRWYWSTIAPQHYTDCPYYSVLLGIPKDQEGDIRKVKLINSQKEDYKKYKYKTYFKIDIIGELKELKKEKYIKVNSNGIELGKNNFILFVKLAVELKRNNEGWVDIESFVQEIDLSFTGRYQLIARLRDDLVKIKALDNNIVKKLIENKKSGLYRISTHPDFITYDKDKLLNHKDPQIRKLAEELP